MKRRLGCVLWTLGGLVLAVLAVRTFVGDVYRIESTSMEPTLRAGEYVFVRHGVPDSLHRYDVLALRSPGEQRSVVKRVVGLPAESVDLRGGDLYVGGHPLPPHEDRPAPILLFDSEQHDLEAFFLHGTTRLDPWRELGDASWRLDASDVAPATDAGLMCTREPIQDGHSSASGGQVAGTLAVDDVAFEGELRWLAGDGRLRVRLGASWDTYQFVLDVNAQGGSRARLSARGEREELVLADVSIEIETNTWYAVGFRLLDGHAIVEFDRALLFSEPLPPKREVDPTAERTPPGGRCCFGGEGVTAEWRALRVLRDLHWPAGPGQASVPSELGPDEIFVLGDNAADSRDSRAWGPVALADVLGRAEAVFWPPTRIRRLRSVAPPRAPRPDVAPEPE